MKNRMYRVSDADKKNYKFTFKCSAAKEPSVYYKDKFESGYEYDDFKECKKAATVQGETFCKEMVEKYGLSKVFKADVSIYILEDGNWEWLDGVEVYPNEDGTYKIDDSKTNNTMKNGMYRVSDAGAPELLDKGKFVLVLYKDGRKMDTLGYANGTKQAKTLADQIFKDKYEYKNDEYDIRVYNSKKFEEQEQYKEWGGSFKDRIEEVPIEYIVGNYDTKYQPTEYDYNEDELEVDNYQFAEDLCYAIEDIIDEKDNSGDLEGFAIMKEHYNMYGEHNWDDLESDFENLVEDTLGVNYDIITLSTEEKKGHYPIQYDLVYEHGEKGGVNKYGVIIKTKRVSHILYALSCKVVEVEKYADINDLI